MLRSQFFTILSIIIMAGSLAAQDGKKTAVLIGVQKYDHADLSELKFTENDVLELGTLLKQGGYNVIILSDGEGKKNAALAPNLVNIRKQLDAAVKGGKRADTMLVALSGHGVQFEGDVESYFCPVDAVPAKDSKKRANLLPISEVSQAMSDGGIGTKLMLVDACRNLIHSSRGLDLNNIRPPKGGGIMFSCSREQRAFELAKHKHGIFFHYVLKGLQGEADNGRGDVTWNSLVDYVSTHVPEEVAKEIGDGARQEPNSIADFSGRSPSLLKLGKTRPDVTAKKPVDAAGYYQLGRAHADKYEIDEAHPLFEKAVELEPRNADYIAWRAYTFSQKNELARAERDAAEALRINPKCHWAWNVKGIVARSRGDLPESIRQYKKSLELAPDVHYFHCNLGVAQLEIGDADSALKSLNRAIELKPESAAMYLFRSRIYAKKAQMGEAIKDVNKATELEPAKAEYRRERSIYLMLLGQFDQALKEVNLSMTLGLKDAESYAARGLIYHLNQNYDLAMADYNQSLKIDPEYGNTYKLRGMLNSKQSQYAKALPDLNEAVKKLPADAEAFYERSLAYMNLNQWDKSLPDISKAIELAPTSALYYKTRAGVYTKLGRTQESQRDLQKAQQLK